MQKLPMALIVLTCIAGAVWLVIAGHPVFGALTGIAAFILAYDKM